MVVSLPAMISRKQEADDLVVAQSVATGVSPAQRGGEIVGGVAGRGRGASFGDELVEVLEQVGRRLEAGGRNVGLPLLPVEQRVGPVAQPCLVGLGHTEHPGDHVHRQARRVVGDQVAVVPSSTSPSRNRRRRARGSSGSRSAMRRGVNARLTSRRSSVCVGRIGRQEHRERVVLLERDAVPRAVGVGIVQRGEHVVVTRQRPEVRVRDCGSRARGRAARGRTGTDRRGTRASTG